MEETDVQRRIRLRERRDEVAHVRPDAAGAGVEDLVDMDGERRHGTTAAARAGRAARHRGRWPPTSCEAAGVIAAAARPRSPAAAGADPRVGAPAGERVQPCLRPWLDALESQLQRAESEPLR